MQNYGQIVKRRTQILFPNRQIRIKKTPWANQHLHNVNFKDPNVAKHLSHLHNKYAVKSHCIGFLIKELSIDNSLGNPTYTPMTCAKEEILDHHRSVLCSFGISTKDEELYLPSLYWIPKLHQCPYKQRDIVRSAKCSTKPLSKLLTYILPAVKKLSFRVTVTLATQGMV